MKEMDARTALAAMLDDMARDYRAMSSGHALQAGFNIAIAARCEKQIDYLFEPIRPKKQEHTAPVEGHANA